MIGRPASWVVIGASLVLFTEAVQIRAQAQGDGYAGPGELVTLFHNEESRKELQQGMQLSDEQVRKAAALAEQFRAEMRRKHEGGAVNAESQRALREKYNRSILSLFPPEKQERLRRAGWIAKGPDALLEREVALKLGLAAGQTEALRKIAEKLDAELRAKLDDLPRVTAEHVRRIHEQFKAKKEAAMVAVLTPEQRKLWQDLQGPVKAVSFSPVGPVPSPSTPTISP